MGKRIRVGYSNTSYSGSTNPSSSSSSSSSGSSSSGSTTPSGSGSATQPSGSSCNCESKLSALETTVCLLQARLSSIENTSSASSSEDIIRVYAAEMGYDNPDMMWNETADGKVVELLLLQEHRNDILEHLFIKNVKVKGSKYEKYFTINSRINIDGDIIKETELNIVAPDWCLPVYNDLYTGRESQIVFAARGKKIQRIDGVLFELDNTQSDLMYRIKMTFPETVIVLNQRVTDNVLPVRSGDVITLNVPRDNTITQALEDNNLDGEYSFTLMAQGSSKTYKILFYWMLNHIVEFP